jgi:hypothetical protein
MEGAAIAELKLHGRPWELTWRGRDEEGEGEGREGLWGGTMGGGCRRGAQPVAPLFSPFSGCLREEENSREEREEKREKRKEEGKEKRKGKNGKNLQTWKFLKKIKDN